MQYSNEISVSVAMATFNGGRFLSEQLESLAKQTMLPIELIVCDDGSTDNTINILEGFAIRAAFEVKIVKNETQLGWRENFLKAASLCRGELVAFCDQDDVWFPEKIEQCATTFLNSDVVLCSHKVIATNDKLSPLLYINQSIRYSRLLSPLEGNPYFVYLGFSQMFRRSLLDTINHAVRVKYSESDRNVLVGHDIWVCFLSFVFGGTFVINKYLAYYRQHSTQATSFGAMEARRRYLSPTKRITESRARGVNRLDVAIDFARQRYCLLESQQYNDEETRNKAISAATYFRRIEINQRARSMVLSNRKSHLLTSLKLTSLLFRGYYSDAKGFRKLREIIKDIVI